MGSRDDAVAAHRETVRVLARPGGPLSPESPHASTHNPAWFTGAQTTAVRDELHDRLIAEYRAAHSAARDERRAIVLAGPPGAGKSTVLTEVLGEDAPGWVRVDADEFKRALLREAIADGSYESVSACPPSGVKVLDSEIGVSVDSAKPQHQWTSCGHRAMSTRVRGIGQMNRARLTFAAAIAALLVSGIPTAASAAADSTGWITSNGRYVLAGCSVYSEWDSAHTTAISTETVSCPGSVRSGIHVGTTYVYDLWRGYQSLVVSSAAGSSHYSGYQS